MESQTEKRAGADGREGLRAGMTDESGNDARGLGEVQGDGEAAG